MESIGSLYLSKYRVTIKPEEQLCLPPYKGSALRGLLGHALRRIVCVTKHSECSDCILKFNCIYSYIMETPIPEEHPFHRKYKTAPHPYIIVPPITKKCLFRPEDVLSFEIILIGKANDYLPYFVYALTEMGKIGVGKGRGKFRVLSIETQKKDGSYTEIFNSNEYTLSVKDDNVIDYRAFQYRRALCDRVTLSFQTPLRIKIKNKLSRNIPFHILIERLAERASLLAHFHCNARLENYEEFVRDSIDVKTIRNDLRWIDWQRYSMRHKTRMKLGGVVGEITYQGPLKKYLSLLRAGEFIHVGKAATFGMGKYILRTEENESL